MSTKTFFAAAAALAAGVLAQASPVTAATKCRLAKYFDLPVSMEGPEAILSTKINGVDTRLIVDTGDFYSMLAPEAAKRLKIRTEPAPGLIVRGIGGDESVEKGEAKEFVFAGVPLKHIVFIVGGRQFSPGTAGLLGDNVLNVADVEYDFAHGMMRFFKETGCHGVDLGYWSPGKVDAIPIDAVTELQPHIIGTAKVNGKSIRVMFDSGASTSLLSLRAAERAGIRVEGSGVEADGLSSGIGRGVQETWIAPVASFALGGEEIKNTLLRVSKMDLGDVDMLLGMDFFLAHRILVSHEQNELYFSYNGGPVFRLDQPASPAARGAAGAEAAKTSDKPADAESLGREGKALMSRRDYAAALRAFDQAVKLQPKEAVRFVDRAKAEEALGKIDVALADYSQALALKPNDATVLLLRGALYLNKDDLAKAGADFEAALKAAPDEGDLQLRVGAAYEARGRYAAAIPHYDVWIAAHSRDEQLWQGLNARCWARAMLGKELDLALHDCNAAIRNGPRNSEVLDSRGMVRLRLGRYREAIADYDAALKLQPKLPWSLYGRGLAKKRLGMVAEGEGDQKAAVALEPTLPEKAKRVGLIETNADVAPHVASAPAGKS